MSQLSQPSAVTHARAWHAASGLVTEWPHLLISWADWYEGPAHLVVQSEYGGPILHFDTDDGPLLESPATELQLAWEDLHHTNFRRLSAAEWASLWGDPEPDQVTAKAAIYTTIASLLGTEGPTQWTARPAKMVFTTEEPVADPDAVFALLGSFPSLMSTVQWYASQLRVGLRRSPLAQDLGWHEPLWLLAENGRPIAVLDEAGRVHLPRVYSSDDNFADLLELVADDADWVAGGLSFDLLDAIGKLDGDLDALAELVRPGARHALGPRRSWNPTDPSKERPEPRRAQDP